jgi:hypothetical protein
MIRAFCAPVALVAQTTTTVADESARNNAALPLMFLAVVVLGLLAAFGPRLARKINDRRPARGAQ